MFKKHWQKLSIPPEHSNSVTSALMTTLHKTIIGGFITVLKLMDSTDCEQVKYMYTVSKKLLSQN